LSKVICSYEACTGCSACSYICNQYAIEMKQNFEGFLYPEVNSNKCVNCNQCVKNCPSNNDLYPNNRKISYYLAWNKDLDIVYKSSSGGIFSALAENFIKKYDGVVFGAAYRDDWSVYHKMIDKIEQIDTLRKSKYLQSDVRDSYFQIKRFLKSGKKILFVGTPCQVQGIISCFYKDPNYKNLFIVDLICHAVQSPKVVLDSINYLERKYNSKCVELDFRSKSRGWSSACTTVIRFSNGKKIEQRLNDIIVGVAFSRNLSIRKSCEKCKYRVLNRNSDITLGDFWNVRNDKDMLQRYGDIGYSTMMINSLKGEELLNLFKDDIIIIEKNEEEVKYANGPLYRQISKNPLREEFFEDYSKMDFKSFKNKWMKPNYKKLIIYEMKRYGKKFGLDKLKRKFGGLK